MEQDPNILFILSDALRARNLQCYGYSRPVSPNIDALAQSGVLLSQAFSCATVTDPSLTTIFSGRYQRAHGIMKHGVNRRADIEKFNASGTPLLPEILKSRNYTTLAVDWLGRWHKRGYDCYTGPSKKRLGTRALYWIMDQSSKRFRLFYSLMQQLFSVKRFVEDAQAVTDKAIELLQKFHQRNFFLFIHYWDTHYPYYSPDRYAKKFQAHDYGKNIRIHEINGVTPKPETAQVHHPVRYVPYRMDRWTQKDSDGMINSNEVLTKYDASIAYVDHQVGRLLEATKDLGVYDNTLIIFTSDHGESLTEHEIYFDHHGLYDVTLHVPLILKHPELPRHKRVDGLVQHTDITPTVLDVLGITHASSASDGTSLLPLIFSEKDQLHDALYFDEVDWERKSAIRTRDHKYIYSPSKADAFCRRCGRIHGGLEELYNLKEDSEEVINIVQSETALAGSLKRRLDDWIQSIGSPKGKTCQASQPLPIDDGEKQEIAERLKKLGYL
ncbi:MAG: sulfatase [Candidatus Bathyarchaeota archaeon]|nr:MAG: sulfatase [Candidatus Bathyarchaeota archaeon]